jgi:Tannase-like family of unknown function (DUF6351)
MYGTTSCVRRMAPKTLTSKKALAAAYRDDLVTSASLGLPDTPVIDQREDLDQAGFPNDIHTTQWSFATRARLLQAQGTAANQVIIENEPTTGQTAAADTYELQAMDQWLSDIQADHSHRSTATKVAEDKPAHLAPGCYLSYLSTGDRLTSPLTDPATGPCATPYPVSSSPRQTAGEPVAENVPACTPRPVDPHRYPSFTPAQKTELKTVFPTGVCDYQLPGTGQTRPLGTWLSYGDGSTGTFGHAPAPVAADAPPAVPRR